MRNRKWPSSYRTQGRWERYVRRHNGNWPVCPSGHPHWAQAKRYEREISAGVHK